MRRAALSHRDRRVLTVGTVVIASLVLGARGIPAWLRWQREARLAARETTTDLVRARATLHDEPIVHDSLAARDKRLVALASAFLSGDTPAAAGATLASLVSGAAATADVRVSAVQVRADSASHEAFTRVAVRASVTGDVHGLTQFLFALERGPILLAVRALSITQPAPSAPATQVEALQADVLIEGLTLNHPSSPRSATRSPARAAEGRHDDRDPVRGVR